jgi:V-type H+-transporting ATPase subunit a
MTFALCLQLPNHLKFKRRVDIYGNFIPQIIFLQSIFGYLVVCIIYKWSIDWSKAKTQPPSLLNMLIAMFLQPGKVDPATQLYPGQGSVQVILLLMAGVCVPWMLITKPYVIWKETRKIQGQGYMGLHDEVPRDSSDEVLEGEEEGNGRVIVESSEAEHVRIPPADYSLTNTDVLFFRNNTISAKL